MPTNGRLLGQEPQTRLLRYPTIHHLWNHKYWSVRIEVGAESGHRNWSDFFVAFNIFTDVVLATLPIPIIWNLQMKRRVRLSVIVILSLGYL